MHFTAKFANAFYLPRSAAHAGRIDCVLRGLSSHSTCLSDTLGAANHASAVGLVEMKIRYVTKGILHAR